MGIGASLFPITKALVLRAAQLRKLRPNSTYVPQLRPTPPYIINVRGFS